jgi:hypothetical protein
MYKITNLANITSAEVFWYQIFQNNFSVFLPMLCPKNVFEPCERIFWHWLSSSSFLVEKSLTARSFLQLQNPCGEKNPNFQISEIVQGKLGILISMT